MSGAFAVKIATGLMMQQMRCPYSIKNSVTASNANQCALGHLTG